MKSIFLSLLYSSSIHLETDANRHLPPIPPWNSSSVEKLLVEQFYEWDLCVIYYETAV